jgi:transcription initiation factor IIE alpha subunit
MEEDQDTQLFDPDNIKKMYHSGDPETSRLAAQKTAKKMSELNAKILDIMDEIYPEGLTDEQLAERLNIQSTVSGNNAAKRRSKLYKDGFIEKTSERRNNKEGSPCVVWRRNKGANYDR